MNAIRQLLRTGIGQKMLMAATGLLLIGFLLVHMGGNLLIFVGPEAYNAYSHRLVSNPLIYLAEAVLLALFVGHFVTGIRVVLRNRSARPTPYAVKRWSGGTSHKSLASTTMILSGLLVLVFVPLHIRGFKFGAWYPSAADPQVRDLYRLVVEEFQSPWLAGWYVLAMVVIGFHLWHGFGSGFESLGVRHRRALRRAGQALAVLIAGGFALVPIVLFVRGGLP